SLVERHRAEPGGGERRQLPEPLPGVLGEPVQQEHAPPGDGTGCEPVERAGASRDRDLRSHAGGSSCHARTVSINESLRSRLGRRDDKSKRTECPLRVKSRHVCRKKRCPLYPPKADIKWCRADVR